MRYPRLITIYGNTRQHARLAEISLFLRHLAAQGANLEIWSDFELYLRSMGNASGLPAAEHPSEQSELVLTLGGDGTLLHALSWCGDRRIPMLGINTGHLGFLTAYTIAETHLLLSDLMSGKLVGEYRTLLRLRCPDKSDERLPDGIWPCALNEVALLKADTSAMIDVRTATDGNYLTDYRADGLIIATPTGSTGYNLSSGGPIVEPTLGCLLLTPIAAHTLSVRPMVVGSGSRIRLRTESRAGSYRVSLDGRSFTMPSGSVLEIVADHRPVTLVRRQEVDFATTLRTKLHWGHPDNE